MDEQRDLDGLSALVTGARAITAATPSLSRDHLRRLSGQLALIHIRRRIILRIQAQVAGILVAGPHGQVRRVIHPVRPGWHRAGLLLPPGILRTGSEDMYDGPFE